MRGHDKKDLAITYRFWLSNNVKREFTVRLDAETLSLLRADNQNFAPWAELGFHRCPNCGLDPALHKYCPVAANLCELTEFFRDVKSHEEADVCVLTKERKYVKRTPVQYVVSSLMEVIMYASGCPVFDRLRPLVKMHIPFPSMEENVRRVMSLYLLEEYFLYKKGGRPDWGMGRLLEFLGEIEVVSASFCGRLSAVRDGGGDACLNAVNNINNLVVITRLSIEGDEQLSPKLYSGASRVKVSGAADGQ